MLTFDRGTEFMAEFAEMIEKDYGIKRKGTTLRNPQVNAIIERVHQTIGNIIQMFSKDNLDENDTWGGILSSNDGCSSIHTSTAWCLVWTLF
jgi:hypothetical protein